MCIPSLYIPSLYLKGSTHKPGGTVTLGDGSCQRRLPVVNMADCSYVHVGLVTDEHLRVPPLGEGGASQGSTGSRGKGLYGWGVGKGSSRTGNVSGVVV